METKSMQDFINYIGGIDNIKSTSEVDGRLVFDLKNVNEVDIDKIKQLSGVNFVNLFQNKLELFANSDTMAQINEQLHNDEKSEKKPKKENAFSKVIDVIASIFSPILPLMAGSGILKGILILLSTMNWLSDNSVEYKVLFGASNAIFYFLPIFLAVSAGKTFKVNPYISGMIGAALLEPNIMALLPNGETTASLQFFRVPMSLMNYGSTVIPSILAICFYAIFEKLIKKYVPEDYQMIIIPLGALVIVFPLTLLIFGPIGVYLGIGLAKAISWLLALNGTIAGALIAGFWSVLVIFGIQWAINPVMIDNIAKFGKDGIIPLTGAANFGMAGAALGVLVRTKNKDLRSYSISSLTALLLAGSTEPTVYGIALPLKKPFIGAIIGSAVGGAIIGAKAVTAQAFVFGSLTSIPAFISKTNPQNVVWYCIALAATVVVSFIVTLILGFNDNDANVKLS